VLQKTLHASVAKILVISLDSKLARLFRKCNRRVGWFSRELPQMPGNLKKGFPAQLNSTINEEGENNTKIQM